MEKILTLDKYFERFFSPKRYIHIKPELNAKRIITSLSTELFRLTAHVEKK
jgi:hypothetical protein